MAKKQDSNTVLNRVCAEQLADDIMADYGEWLAATPESAVVRRNELIELILKSALIERIDWLKKQQPQANA
jgi:hypothetical protein